MTPLSNSSQSTRNYKRMNGIFAPCCSTLQRLPLNKDKEALFDVTYNETDTIISQAILGHNYISLTDTYMYLPYSIFLARPF